MKTQSLSTAVFSSSEIQIHYKRPLFDSMKSISSADDAHKVVREFSDSNRIDLKEFFWAIYLSNANRLLAINEIGMGNSLGTIVSVKEIFQGALLTNASGMIIAHNHPSGKLRFSVSDKELTERIYTLAKTMEVTLLDHIVITSEGFISFANEGLFSEF
jgi:DNA repair protein RadC